METLGKLFGSIGKVKIMRLFIFNPDTPFDAKDVSLRSDVLPQEVALDLRTLEQAGFIRRRPFFKDVVNERTEKMSRVKASGWVLDDRFLYATELQNLLVHTVLFSDSDIIKRLSRAGVLKFVAIAGVFIREPESRVDLLVVGDNLKEKVIVNTVHSLEAEVGKEIRYVLLETEDFKYRYGVFDKLVRDVLDYPHRTIIDRVGIKKY